MSPDVTPDEPIDDEVPVTDAVDQRREVREMPPISEHFEPTAVNELVAEPTPPDADPADWQEQRTTAPDDWDVEDDR